MFTELEDINSYRSKIAANLAVHARKKFKLSPNEVCRQFGLSEKEYLQFEVGSLILDEKSIFEILEYFLISKDKIQQSFELSHFLYFYDINLALAD